jgi:hypothetical protein
MSKADRLKRVLLRWVYLFEADDGLTFLTRLGSEYFVWVSPSILPGASYATMSRIFEALKHAQLVRAGKVSTKSPATDAVEVPDRRRSRRWALDIPVYVYGHGQEKEPFHEEAHTLHVNANGALLLLSVPVRKGQILLLTNSLTQQEQDCRVVFIGTKRSRTVEAGIAFPLTNPEFWQLPTASGGENAS